VVDGRLCASPVITPRYESESISRVRPVANIRYTEQPVFVSSIIAVSVGVHHHHTKRSATNSSSKDWVGGFRESNKAFDYSPPDLSSLPVLHNLDNIDKLDRMQVVKWPEFSWLTKPPDNSSRCYQTFATNISRLGYTKEGRVYSIICPQQGVGTDRLGNLNVEVSVTGQRGWVDEPNKTLAADMSVTGLIWFSPGAKQNSLVKRLAPIMSRLGPFPFEKEHAINVTTHRRGRPNQPLFPLLNGTNEKTIAMPEFAEHWADKAYGVGTLDVQIGAIKKQEKGFARAVVNTFNQLVIDVFNLASGNLLKDGNVLSWNVWFTKPEVVNQTEWGEHAEKWRTSLEVDHVSPDGDASPVKYYNGTTFTKPTFPFRTRSRLLSVADFEGAPFEPASEEERLINEFRVYLNENRALLQPGAAVVSRLTVDMRAEGDEDLDTLLRMLDEEIDKW
jgi:hypothetical protein